MNSRVDSKPLLHNAGKVLSSNLVRTLIGIASGILLARYLGPDQRGQLGALMVVPSMLVSLLNLGIRQSVVRELGKQDFPARHIVRTVVVMSFWLSVVAVAGGGVVFSLFYAREPLPFILLAISVAPAMLTTSLFSGIMLANDSIGAYSRLRVYPSILQLAGVLVLVVLFAFQLTGALVAQVVAYYLVACYAMLWLMGQSRDNGGFRFDVARRLTSVGLVYAIALFSLALNYRIDIILLRRYSTLSQIGQYTIGVGLAEQLWQIPAAIGVLMFVKSSRRGNNDIEFVARVLRLNLLVALGLSGLLFVFSQYLVPFVYGPDYLESVGVVRTIIPGVFIFIIFKILYSDLAGRGKPQVALFVMIPSVLLNVILNIILIPTHGAQGAALASSISYVFGAVLFLICYKNSVGVPLQTLFAFRFSDFADLRRMRG